MCLCVWKDGFDLSNGTSFCRARKMKAISPHSCWPKRKEFVYKLYLYASIWIKYKCKFQTETKAFRFSYRLCAVIGVRLEISILSKSILTCCYANHLHLLFAIAIAIKISIWAAAWFTILVYLKLYCKQWILNYENNNNQLVQQFDSRHQQQQQHQL